MCYTRHCTHHHLHVETFINPNMDTISHPAKDLMTLQTSLRSVSDPITPCKLQVLYVKPPRCISCDLHARPLLLIHSALGAEQLGCAGLSLFGLYLLRVIFKQLGLNSDSVDNLRHTCLNADPTQPRNWFK